MPMCVGDSLGLPFLKATQILEPQSTEPLELTFTTAIGKTLEEWNTIFDLPTNGIPFTSVINESNLIKLYGGQNISIRPWLFEASGGLSLLGGQLTSIDDKAHCVKRLGDYAFGNFAESNISLLDTQIFPAATGYVEYSPGVPPSPFWGTFRLRILKLPQMPIINDYAVQTYYGPIDEIDFRSCTSLGSDVLNNNVFFFTGKTLTVTLPQALMTCNGGNPDGDIQYLLANNTVTLITV